MIKTTFVEESRDNLRRWEEIALLLEEGDTEVLLGELFRIAHNMKGSSRMIGEDDFADQVHRVESLIESAQRNGTPVSSTFSNTLLECHTVLESRLNTILSPGTPVVSSKKLESLIKKVRDELGLPEAAGSKGENSQTAISSEASQDIVFLNSPNEAAGYPSKKRNQSAERGSPKTGQQRSDASTTHTEFVRVKLDHLNQLINLVGELMVNQSFVHERRTEAFDNPEIIRSISKLTKDISEVRNLLMTMRMKPLKEVFQRQKRTVRDTREELNKDVEFVTSGDWVELDKAIIDALGEPLTHLLRNAVDHGIEDEETRKKLGKSSKGNISCEANYKDDVVEIVISDDGSGIDTERVWQKAVGMGLVDPDEPRWPDERVHSLIFAPNFSTKEEVNLVSGRGVGMDVVREKIESLKGSITVRSKQGAGSQFIITLPLSLSIITGLVVRVSDERYVVPISQMVKTIHFHTTKVETCAQKGRMLMLEDGIIPLLSLSENFGSSNSTGEERSQPKSAVVTQDGPVKVAWEVDEIEGQQSVVLKPLSEKLEGIPGLMAGTILNDGEPSLVLHLPGLSNSWRSNYVA